MAKYVLKAQKLKPLVEAANFTPEQLTLIHKMMGNCSQLRQRKVITSFLELMIPDNMEIVTDHKNKIILASGYSFYPQYVILKGSEIPRQKPQIDNSLCEICKKNKPDLIQFGKVLCNGCADNGDQEE